MQLCPDRCREPSRREVTDRVGRSCKVDWTSGNRARRIVVSIFGMGRRLRGLRPALLALLVLVPAGHASTRAVTAASCTKSVDIVSNSFDPILTAAQPGDTVCWTNYD